MDRRTFIAVTAGAGLAGVSGCVAEASPRPPQVSEEQLDDGGWELLKRETEEVFTQEFAGQEVTATANTELYTNARLSEDLSEKTLDQMNGQIVSFFASRVTFDPDVTNLPGGVGRGEILDQVEDESRKNLRDQMTAAGIEDVEQVDEGSLTVETGEEARQTDFEGVFSFDAIEFPVTDDESIELDGEPMTVNGHLAIWHHEDSVLVAGGAYPAENYDETIEKELSSAIDVTVDIDLGLDPDAMRTELFDLVTTVS